MDWRIMPPMAALRAFAAYADSENLVQAGEALNVSHAAISQQLRALEAHLGVALLDRSGRALALTAEGAHLARALALGFGAIHTAVQELTTSQAARPLHVTCTPSFAAHWLVPRLPDFQAQHPEISLVLDPSGGVVPLTVGGVDLALRYGDGQWSGLESEQLLAAPMVVVAAPALLAGRQVGSAADLLDLPWLEELGTNEASRWFQAQGIEEGFRGPRTRLPGNLLMQAVRDGQGVAVSVQNFVADDLSAGRLQVLFRAPAGGGYHIVTRPGVLRPETRAFVAWLRRLRDRGD